MSMSAGPAEDGSPMSDINTTPLVDVMLVLLIIFLITVPVVIQTVPVKLPTVFFEPTVTKPENVSLSVRVASNGACEVYWGQTPVNSTELVERAVAKLRREIDKQGGPNTPGLELPEAHIRGDINTPYRCIGGAVFNMQRAGFVRVGFI
ncbi:MAG: biopolymer transporter ExbD, partial [Alphaproteobacteria bacterium]